MGKIIGGWEGNYEKGTCFFGWGGGAILGASTFQEPQCEAGKPQKPQERFLGVCLVVQAVDGTQIW